MRTDNKKQAIAATQSQPAEHVTALDYERFKQIVSVSKTDICTTLYRQNRDLIRIKKEHVAASLVESASDVDCDSGLPDPSFLIPDTEFCWFVLII